MNIHVARALATLAAVAMAATVPAVAAGAIRAERGTTPALSVADAPYYLDVHDEIPPSFRQLGPEELAALAGAQDPDSAAAGYMSDDEQAFLVLRLMVGTGRSAWSVFEHDVAHAEEVFRAEDLAQMLADAEHPSDQISVAPAEWTDVAAGDSARTALFNVDVAQLGTVHFEVLVMAVHSGPDAALVVVAHAFAGAPSFSVVDVASKVAARVKSGPPTPERTIAEGGLIAIGDLPAGWQERTDGSSDATPSVSTTPTAGTAEDSTGGGDLGHFRKVAKSIPACKGFVSLLDGSVGGGVDPSGTTGSDELELHGAEFGLGPGTVASWITVYPTAATATAFFRLLRAPSTKACLTKLYVKATQEGLDAAAKSSGRHAGHLPEVHVVVTTPRATPVGDDRLLFRVSAELPSTGHIRVVWEQEYVRTGRAVAQYVFSDVGKVTIRDDVVRTVSDRVATAPGVRGDH